MAKNGMLARSEELRVNFQLSGSITIGIDLGDQFSYCCVLGPDGEVLTQGRVRSTKESLARHFRDLPRVRIAIEVGGHSRWVNQALSEWGHEVIVANPRNLRLIADHIRKSDHVDAEMLARLARVDPTLLSPISHRSQQGYSAMTYLRSRDLLVRARTRLMNAVRGTLKAVGLRVPASGAPSFPGRARLCIPEELKPSLAPLLETIAHLNQQISLFDKAVEKLAREQYPETSRLRQISGVGPLTALQFVLTIGDPTRFKRSRDVAAYIGLTPRRRQSGEVDPQLRISKAGNRQLRSLLVQCAQYLLGPFSPDSDIKRWATQKCRAGGKNGKKRMIIAVSRKLAVLLHRLWVTGDTYNPLHNTAAACRTGI